MNTPIKQPDWQITLDDIPETQRDALKALNEIMEIAENCLHGNSPLIARQTFGSPLRSIRRIAANAITNAEKAYIPKNQ